MIVKEVVRQISDTDLARPVVRPASPLRHMRLAYGPVTTLRQSVQRLVTAPLQDIKLRVVLKDVMLAFCQQLVRRR